MTFFHKEPQTHNRFICNLYLSSRTLTSHSFLTSLPLPSHSTPPLPLPKHTPFPRNILTYRQMVIIQRRFLEHQLLCNFLVAHFITKLIKVGTLVVHLGVRADKIIGAFRVDSGLFQSGLRLPWHFVPAGIGPCALLDVDQVDLQTID